MRTFSLISVALLLAGACASAFAQAPMGTWSTAAPLPQPRAEHSVIGLNGKLYAIAGGIPNVDGPGMQNNGASTLVEDYDRFCREFYFCTISGIKPRHNYRYVCAELIRLYYRGQKLLSHV
jgi:hypothetical protein